jgi:hypothetical protein
MKEAFFLIFGIRRVFKYPAEMNIKRHCEENKTPFQAGNTWNMVFPGLSGDIIFLYYKLLNEKLRKTDEIKCLFSVSIFSQQKIFFTVVKHISVFSLVSCQTTFCCILPIYKI